jgi:hypothetical protein
VLVVLRAMGLLHRKDGLEESREHADDGEDSGDGLDVVVQEPVDGDPQPPLLPVLLQHSVSRFKISGARESSPKRPRGQRRLDMAMSPNVLVLLGASLTPISASSTAVLDREASWTGTRRIPLWCCWVRTAPISM